MKEKIIDTIEDAYRNVKYGLINIIQWMPIVWNDRDWDQWYLLKLLEFKLLKMEKLFRRYGNHTGSDKQAKQLKKCAEIFKRLYEENYSEEAFKKHDEKWGEIEVEFIDTDNPEFHEIVMNRENMITDEDKVKQRHESNICMQNSYKAQGNDLKEVFAMMRDNILGWWD